ncbi:OmpH family outer membrane protein [Altericroceibacterium spongiae]|uniref:OmpH family outer membrane protein n=1 Tax=Altericroceibacterium spongiae TaxID=2320269 RepID=A0A420EMS2_9SPHN|nr:OmpH family outer membrane protein [Altericroceibacterium spongiae]RKF21980.1 OmpH family outer membrane protein [Altericroceibacterium spongiae]
MKHIFKPAFAAGIAIASLTAPMAVAPASAQAAQSIGVVNPDAVVTNSAAYQAAQQQRQTTYQAQIQQAQQRRDQIQAELDPLIQKLQADSQAANANQQALQQQAATIQQKEQAGQRELQQILAPYSLSQAYVEEQINDKLMEAVQNAAKKRNVTLVLDATSGAVAYAEASYNITQDAVNELNALLPSVQVVPPEGWLPRRMRQQQAQQQQAQQQQTQPAAAPGR